MFTTKTEVLRSLIQGSPTLRALRDLEKLHDSAGRYDQRVKNAFELHIWTFNTKPRQELV